MRFGTIVRQVIAQFANPAAAFIAGPILARVLGPGDRGALAAATDTIFLLVVVCASGLSDTAALTWARGEREGATFLRRHRARILLGGLAAVAVAVGLALTTFRHEPGTELILLSVAGVLPVLVLIEVSRGSAMGSGRYGLLQAESYITNIGRLAAVAALALFGALVPLTAGIATVALMLIGGSIYLLRRSSPPDLTRPVPAAATAAEGRVAWRYWSANVASTTAARSMTILLLALGNATQAGLFAIAISISGLLPQTVYAMRQLLFRVAARDASGASVARMGRIVTPSIAVVVLVLEFTAGPVVVGLFGERFAPSIPVLHVTLLAVIPITASQIWGIAFSGIDRQDLFAIAEWISVGITVVGLVLTASWLGAIGAAGTVVVGAVVMMAWNVYWLRRLTGLTAREFVPLPTVADLRWLRSRTRRVPAGSS